MSKSAFNMQKKAKICIIENLFCSRGPRNPTDLNPTDLIANCILLNWLRFFEKYLYAYVFRVWCGRSFRWKCRGFHNPIWGWQLWSKPDAFLGMEAEKNAIDIQILATVFASCLEFAERLWMKVSRMLCDWRAKKTASVCRRVLLILPHMIAGKSYSSMGFALLFIFHLYNLSGCSPRCEFSGLLHVDGCLVF